MTQIITMKDKATLATQLGESHFREFKSALEGAPNEKKDRDIKEICIDIARTLVAFSNADGGELLVGVEDDGTVTGIHHSERNIEIIKNAYKTHIHKETPISQCKCEAVEIDGKKIIYFIVSQNINYCCLTSDGKCLQRRDLESVPVPFEKIKSSRQEKISKEYEREYIRNGNLLDLDNRLLSETSDIISKGMSPEKCLQYLGLAEFYDNTLMIRRSAFLLFGKEINKWHPRVQVRIIKVDGINLNTGKEYNVIFDDFVSNNIISLIENSWEMLRPHLTETRLSDDAIFKNQIIYPELACREALINAIAHRDYSNEGRGIEIYVYSDRIEIKNPGELLSTISVDDLNRGTGAHQSRNSLVSRVLREIGFMRELGEGIRRINKLMAENDLIAPTFETSSGSFSITLSQKLVYSPKERLWLDNFSQFRLSREEKTVIRLGIDGNIFSAHDIWEACGIIDTDDYRKVIEALYKKKILTSTISSNESRAQARKLRIPHKQLKRYKIVIEKQTYSLNRTPVNRNEEISNGFKVYVSNVPYSATKESIFELFKTIGEIEDITIPLDMYGKLRGFAFVEFSTKEEFNSAIDNSGKLELLGRKLFISEATVKRSYR